MNQASIVLLLTQNAQLFLYIEVRVLRQLRSWHPYDVRNFVLSFEHNTQFHSGFFSNQSFEIVAEVSSSGGNNFNNFPENQLTKFRAFPISFRDSGRDSVAIDDERDTGGIYTIRTTCWIMHNACACGRPVIGWSTHARACT